jgi:predicted PurR-regulated permease PerM
MFIYTIDDIVSWGLIGIYLIALLCCYVVDKAHRFLTKRKIKRENKK